MEHTARMVDQDGCLRLSQAIDTSAEEVLQDVRHLLD